jgi:hypothetical protein
MVVVLDSVPQFALVPVVAVVKEPVEVALVRMDAPVVVLLAVQALVLLAVALNVQAHVVQLVVVALVVVPVVAVVLVHALQDVVPLAATMDPAEICAVVDVVVDARVDKLEAA